MTRHFSHIFFTDGLTFMPYFDRIASLLLYRLIGFSVKRIGIEPTVRLLIFETIGNSSFGQIVRC